MNAPTNKTPFYNAEDTVCVDATVKGVVLFRKPSRRWTLDNISSGDFTTIQKSSTKRT